MNESKCCEKCSYKPHPNYGIISCYEKICPCHKPAGEVLEKPFFYPPALKELAKSIKISKDDIKIVPIKASEDKPTKHMKTYEEKAQYWLKNKWLGCSGDYPHANLMAFARYLDNQLPPEQKEQLDMKKVNAALDSLIDYLDR